MLQKPILYFFISILLSLGVNTWAQPVLSPDPDPTFLVEARARNGASGYEGVIFTPGDPSPGTGATQLNPVGAPAWTYGQNHPFEFRYIAATGTCIWNIDFNRDGDFLDAEESATSVSPTLVDRGFEYVNIWMQGSTVPSLSVSVNNFTLNGVNFGNFSSTSSTPTTQLFEETSGKFTNILATGTVNFSGGNGQERPRFWIRLGALVVLPNQLIEFTVKKDGNNRILEWLTENENATREFNIERSADGIDFQTIGTVIAKNLPGINQYTFTDRGTSMGTAFYRLKTIDLDGRYTLSSLLKTNERSKLNALQIYPNPSKGSFSIILPNESPANIRILNLSGKTILERSTKSQSINFNLGQTPPGIYFVTIFQQGQATTERLLIQ
jgi:hypothetical protein